MNPNTTSIEDRLNADFAEAWKPEPGDTLIGEIVEIGERDGGYGPYPIVTIRQDDTSVLAVHAFHTVLASQLAEQHPAIGDRIGIRYKGRVTSEGARGGYHSYRVTVDRPAGGNVDWSKYGETPPADEQDSEYLVSIEPEHADDEQLQI
jgi:hypothetical protein